MWHLTFHPTAGYILNAGEDASEPGRLAAAERRLLRDLAQAVQAAAAHPKQAARRALWYRHNALEATRPPVLVFLEDSWQEVYPVAGNTTVQDLFWRQWEWYLKHLLFRDAHIGDDFVIEPDLIVPLQVSTGGWGLPPARQHRTADPHGSYSWDPPLADPGDIRKLRPATIAIEREATTRRLDAVGDVFGDLLPVRLHCAPSSWCLVDVAAGLRGIAQLMLDMYDRPKWLHELMAFIAGEELRRRQYLEAQGVLTLNNRNHYVDAGGIAYTNELPAGGFDGTHARLGDLWCHAAAQAASEIGPEHHEEFILEHELPILELAGLNVYGCCEPYTHKFDMLKRRVPRLRRVSVSPWCDVARAAAELQDKYILSWKPNPALLVGAFSEERIRSYVRGALDAARDCRLEIILKDTITLDRQPDRLTRWLRIVREEIDAVCPDG
jgi:hypothetical protein